MARVARLLHHDGREPENGECDDSGEHHVHDRNREPARDPDPSETAHERVEEQRDEQRDEKDEDRVTHGSGHHPEEHEQEREAYELHPARDLDPRRGGASLHAIDGIAGVRRIRSGWEWTDGALALQIAEDCDTVPVGMPSSRPTRRRVERREMRSARRARRFALLIVLATVLLIALALTAFGGSGVQRLQRLSVTGVGATASTAPFPQVIALHGAVRLQMPIPQSLQTAIGYHTANDGALALSPVGHQGNEGLLQRVFHRIFGGGGGHPLWYRLDGGTMSAADVGAPPGTDVYSPVDGVVVGITPFVVAGHRFGSRVDIQPQSAPSLVVSLTQLRSDPSLSVGEDVVSGATKLGTVVDLSQVERQALSRYTNDAGNHVSIELHPAAVLVLN